MLPFPGLCWASLFGLHSSHYFRFRAHFLLEVRFDDAFHA